MGDYIGGITVGLIQGDIRSLDYGSYKPYIHRLSARSSGFPVSSNDLQFIWVLPTS